MLHALLLAAAAGLLHVFEGAMALPGIVEHGPDHLHVDSSPPAGVG